MDDFDAGFEIEAPPEDAPDEPEPPAPKPAPPPPPPPEPEPEPEPKPTIDDGGFDMEGFDQQTGEIDLDELDDESAFGDISDLPAPRDEYADLPAPREMPSEYADLPAPKGPVDDGIDLPAPKEMPSEYADLPIPKEGTIDLPAPKEDMGDFDLPQPKGDLADFDLPEPKGDRADFDLPEPKGDGGLAPKGATDLPAPKGEDLLEPKADLPEPKGLKGFFEYGQVDLKTEEGINDLDELPVAAGMSVSDEMDVDLPPPDISDDEALPPPVTDELVADEEPTEEPDKDDVVTFAAPRMEGEEAVVVQEEPDDDAKDEAAAKRRIRIARYVILGVLAVVAVGVVTSLLGWGFLGIGLLTGTTQKTQQAETLLDDAHKQFAADTYAGYKQSAAAYKKAGGLQPDETELPARHVHAVAAMIIRFGANKAAQGEAELALSKLDDSAEAPSNAIQARALMKIVQGRPKFAVPLLKEACKMEGADAFCWLFAGWAHQRMHQHAPAIAAFKAALKMNPKLVGAQFALAQVVMQLPPPRNKSAPKLLEQLVKKNPHHTGAKLLRAQSLMQGTRKQQKQGAKVLEQVAKALGKAAPSEIAEALTTLGQHALQEGDVDEARKRFEIALKAHPKSSAARIGRGQILFQAKKYKDAQKQFREASNLDPTSVQAKLMIAHTEMATGDPKKARVTLIAVQKMSPSSPMLKYLLGQVEQQLGSYARAKELYQQAINLRRTYFAPYLSLAHLHLKQKKPDEALKVLAQADKAIPGSARVRNAQGEIYLASKKLKKASKAFAQALKLDSKLNVAIFNLANTYFQLGQLDRAKQKYLALQKRDKQYPGLAENLGRLYVMLKDYDKATKQYDIALSVDQPSPALRLAAAKAYVLNKQYDKTLAQAKEATRVDPSSMAEAHALRAQALLAKKEPQKALEEIAKSISREAGRAEYQVTRGKVLEALGRNRAAMDAYTIALEKDKSLPGIRERLGILMVKAGMARDGLKVLKKVVDSKRKSNVKPGGELFMYAGVAYLDLGQEREAEKAFHKATELEPKLGLAHFKLGMMAVDKRKWRQAYKRFMTALPHATKSDLWRPNMYYYLCAAADGLKKKKEVVKYCTEFLGLAKPGDALKEDAQKRRVKNGWKPEKEEGLLP